VFAHQPTIGLVSSWALDLAHGRTFWSRPSPAFPAQWLANDVVPFSAIRMEALEEAERVMGGLHTCRSHWDLFDAVLTSSWKAVTVPQILGEAHFDQLARPYLPDQYSPIRNTV
jgi:hypothetical protein